jgi:integrase
MNEHLTSVLGDEMRDFLSFKRALGHPYQRGGRTLCSFDRYVAQHCGERNALDLAHLISGWLSAREGRKPVSVANELGVVRQFCLWRQRRAPGSFVPGRQWAPQSTESDFTPYIFSPGQIRGLLDAARALRGPRFRSVSKRMLLLILYCTGLRIGEAVRLRLADVDMRHSVFTIRHSKRRTRLVPFGADLTKEIQAYLLQRRSITGDSPESRLLVHYDGTPYNVKGASFSIRRLLRCTGLKPPKGRVGPRVHDLRHTFAVHRLTEWYRQGEDIHAWLPWLSAYMGHDNLLGTESYLNATPELLAIAGERFRALCFGEQRHGRATPRRPTSAQPG